MKHLESDWRRYKKAAVFVEKVMPLFKKYKLYIDVISNYVESNYVESNYVGLKELEPYIINYDSKKAQKRLFIVSNHYICLKIDNKNILENLLERGGEYLQFQFRFCDGDVGVISEEEIRLFEMKEEISETLFEDSRTMAVIKDKFDCLGFHIMYRENIEKKYETLVNDITNLS